jgi:integrase
MAIYKVTGHQSKSLREEEIIHELTGYWENNQWNAIYCPLYTEEVKIKIPNIKFNQELNAKIRNEFKYYFYKRLTNLELKMSTVWNSSSAFNKLQSFILRYYQNINSILDVHIGKFTIHFKTYLLDQGHTDKTVRDYLHLYNQMYSYFNDLYDERDELAKDIWDVRNLGIDYNNSRYGYNLNFTSIPIPFKDLVKRYMEKRVIVQESLSWGSAIQNIAKLQEFFKYIHGEYPSWEDIITLSRKDIENFIHYLRSHPMGGNSVHKGKVPSNSHVKISLSVLESFIVYIQRYEWIEAPTKPVRNLILPEDKPKLPSKSPEEIKYISDLVWKQIIYHMAKLPKEILPIVLLLETTGFRISDICRLKIDCLIKREDGWWITGEQRKVKDKNHRVPISEEIAKVIVTQQELTRSKSTIETNPLNYLFPIYRGKRKGQPIARSTIVNNLNKLAYENNIIDEKGSIYRCKAHAFRHRYGVNLINNGMNILHVQKLMAHASPEMTLVYAQIHDTTLRKEWEKAINNGAIKINQGGKILPTNIEQQASDNGLELEWIRHNLDSIRLDHGFCIKSPKHNCDFLEQTIEPPCIRNNCRSFHVDRSFLDYYEEQINKIESDIQIYQRTGRNRSIEIIQPKLIKYKEIRDGIINNGGIFGHPKSRRESRI